MISSNYNDLVDHGNPALKMMPYTPKYSRDFYLRAGRLLEAKQPELHEY
jgi:hypothetical protein